MCCSCVVSVYVGGHGHDCPVPNTFLHALAVPSHLSRPERALGDPKVGTMADLADVLGWTSSGCCRRLHPSRGAAPDSAHATARA